MTARHLILLASLLVANFIVFAQDTPGPSTKEVKYSPYPGQDYTNQVLNGDEEDTLNIKVESFDFLKQLQMMAPVFS